MAAARNPRTRCLLLGTSEPRAPLATGAEIPGWRIEHLPASRWEPAELRRRAPRAVVLDPREAASADALAMLRSNGSRAPVVVALLEDLPDAEESLAGAYDELITPATSPHELGLRLGVARQRARQARRTTALQQQMIAAQRLARCGSWHFDPGNDEILLSEEACHVLGMPAHAGAVSLERFLARVPAERHESVHNWMAELLAGIETRPLLHPLLHPGDGQRILMHRAQALMDDEGQVISLTGVVTDVTDERRELDQLRHETHHDSLTGLANRRELERRFEAAVEQASAADQRVAVLYLDLDQFKRINQSLGHRVGDRLLMLISERLSAAVDGEVGGPEEIEACRSCIARIGGDEFAVLLPCLETEEEATAVAGRALELLRAPFEVYGQEVFVSASIGIATYPDDQHEPGTLIKCAETAMFRAKARGGGLQRYASSMNDLAREHMSLENSLRGALERGEMEVFYQPKNETRTRRLVGFEALVRWHSPDLGMVSPAKFIPIAEQTGLIVPLGEWVLETACKQILEWQRQDLPAVHVSVNLSGRQFTVPGIARRLAEVLRSTGLRPEFLELELTESTLMSNTDSAIEVMQALKAAGIRLSIDDFGTGYSSLSYLKDFPIDVVKIDRSFVSPMLVDEGSRSLVEAILGIARSLHLKVVAEGVETEEQLALLQELDCDLVQGYLFSPPVPAAAARELLERELASAPS